MEREKGVICAIVGARGFGFIGSGAGEDFRKWWFHISQFEAGKMPIIGLAVSFVQSPIQTGKNPVAIDVRVVESGAL